MRCGWVVTEVMNMVENCWFNESNSMLCEARGGLEPQRAQTALENRSWYWGGCVGGGG